MWWRERVRRSVHDGSDTMPSMTSTRVSTALFTDRYELTMLDSALREGSAERRCVFEVFARRLPDGRRYGVVAGTGRLVEAITDFSFDAATIDWLRAGGVIDATTAEYLASYRFGGDVDGYPEGELFFPHSPILTVSGTFAEAVVLETLALSVLNHDSAIASAAARMVTAASGRPIIEMGSRRTHEQAAVASARAAYLAGFASTSNLAASERYGLPTAGTAAHAFTLLHDDERSAFAAQVAALGPSTTLLVDTYDITRGIELAVEVAGPSLGAIRIDSGDLAVLGRLAREQLDRLGATGTRIVVSGDLDEFAIAALAAAPVDAYGAGTAVVTGSGAPTAGLVYKLVEVDGRPVAKRSEHKQSQGGRKTALRAHKPTGTAIEEVVVSGPAPPLAEGERLIQRPFLRGGTPVADRPTLDASREHLRAATVTLPWDGLKLSRGEPAIPTRIVPAP
ncbi:MAG: nicotinate phosphoribosyltransferase [Pseudonocardiales bacterium]|nr:nicotinate phosphoribosyltransferase [Pseudonocardiales bacterium]